MPPTNAAAKNCHRTGRWLVAKAGVSIYQIGSQKSTPNGLRIIAINGGMSDNPRNALYQAKYTAVINGKIASNEVFHRESSANSANREIR